MSGRRRKLWNGDRLSAVVDGAIESAINDHGTITKANMTSVTKRVVSQVRAYGFNQLVTPTQHARDWEQKYNALKYGHDILVRQHQELRERLCQPEPGSL